MPFVPDDLRYAWRSLRRTPAFTFVAVLTLALGLATTTTVFSLAEAVAFKRPPMVRFDDVSVLSRVDRVRKDHVGLSRGDVQVLETRVAPDIAIVAAHTFGWPEVVQVPGRAASLTVERITGDYARVFGVSAERGRWVERADIRTDGVEPVVVVSDRFWREWFHADADAVGRAALTIGGVRHVVIGVAPRGFVGVQSMLAPSDLWTPLGPWPPAVMSRAPRDIETFVRPQAGASAAAATVIAALLDGEPGSAGRPTSSTLTPMIDRLRPIPMLVRMAGGAVTLALLVLAACATNVANMMHARGIGRARDIAVRQALGASRFRVGRLLVTEAFLVAAGGALLGVLLAAGALRVFVESFPKFTFFPMATGAAVLDVSPDLRVSIASVAVAISVALVVGATTAWRASGAPLLRTLGTAGAAVGTPPQLGWLRRGQVAVQVTAAMVLVTIAGMYLNAGYEQLDRQLRFDTAPLLSARFNLGLHGYPEARGRRFADRLLAAVSKIPGVEHATLATGVPGAQAPTPKGAWLTAESTSAAPAGGPRRVNGSFIGVSPAFLKTMGIGLVRGRDLSSDDTVVAPRVAVVSVSAADALWPGQDALGRRFMFGDSRQWITVVGISADPVRASDDTPYARWANFVFLPLDQNYQEQMIVLARSATPAALVDPLRFAIRGVDADVAAFDTGPADEMLFPYAATLRAVISMLTAMGALSLAIAIIGVYGVVAYFVSVREKEFAVRMALGATSGRIVRLVVDQAVHILLVGLLVGVFIASLAMRLTQVASPGATTGIVMWVTVPLLLVATGVVAALIPALRAARVDPLVTLRAD